MWLTGFDVECLSTLYIDKPMKAHTLMQAIARANRVYPGKDCGLIVDYNGMLASLRPRWRNMRWVTMAREVKNRRPNRGAGAGAVGGNRGDRSACAKPWVRLGYADWGEGLRAHQGHR